MDLASGGEGIAPQYTMTTQMYELTPNFSIDLSTIRSVDTSTPVAHVQLNNSAVVSIAHMVSKSYVCLMFNDEITACTVDIEVARKFLRSAILRSILLEQAMDIPILNPEDDDMPGLVCGICPNEHSGPCPVVEIAPDFECIVPPLCPADESDNDSSSDYDPVVEARRFKNAAQFLKLRRKEKAARSVMPLRVEVMMNIRDENLDAKFAHTTIDFTNATWFRQSDILPSAYDVVFANGTTLFAAPNFFEFFPNGCSSPIPGMWNNQEDHARISRVLKSQLVYTTDGCWVNRV